MNGTVGRRVFVGSLAAAGVGAVGAASLLEFPASAQRGATTPLTREIRRQLKEALGKMREGQADAARQASTVLRLYASTVNDNQLKAALRKANRQQILLAQVNHGELVRQAEELGINPSRLPPHSLNRVGREAALDRLIKEGLSPLMLQVADVVDGVGEKLRALERRGGARALQVALRQPIPDYMECGSCEQEKGQMEAAMQIMTVTCAASLVFPPLAEVCAAASATYLTFYGAHSICLAIVAFCEAYYNN
jgi:hypothetical protein